MSLVVILNDEYRAKYFDILKKNVCVKSILKFDVIYIFYSFVIILCTGKGPQELPKFEHCAGYLW